MTWPYRAWRWRNEIWQVSNETSTDQNLIVAIMDRESLCGDALTPVGSPQGVGDGGHGRGLMQIDDRSHTEFCSDIKQWGDAYQNILFGVGLLRTYMRKLGCLERGIAAYNCGPAKVTKSGYYLSPQLDKLTTHGDYVTDVLRRMHWFTKAGEKD